MNRAWLSAVALPVAIAVLVPCTVALVHLIDPGFALPHGPAFVHWSWLGLLAAWAGWRVVRRRAGDVRSAALAGVAIYVAAAVPGLVAAIVTAAMHVASPFNLLPTVILVGVGLLINLVMGAAAAMFVGWFGGRLASRGTSSDAA